MNNIESQYIEACRDILLTGNTKSDRTGTGTISKVGIQLRANLKQGFPLLTTKKVYFKSVVAELLWFLRGDTNIQYLKDNNCKIWDAWATEDGEVGNMYGYQWRHWQLNAGSIYGSEVDQIKVLIDTIVRDPDSRRLLVSAWNVNDLPKRGVTPQGNATHGFMALAPCHYSFQCYVANGELSMIVNQRSADMFLGVPFNIASYALLTKMIAQVCDLKVGELIWNGADCHLYTNHINQIKEQIARYDAGEVYDFPNLKLDESVTNIDNFTLDSIELFGYKSGTSIKAPVAI